ncbi:MAG: helix-turn-helix transcriptional regulator [Bdellovibrionales bacterium]|nr:helix-turn-helix transcriptional regulator [Bdellovibrionales bacterium]
MIERLDFITKKVLEAKNYTSWIKPEIDSLISMKRVQSYHHDRILVDTYGPIWIVGFSNIHDGQISIKNSGEWLCLEGSKGFFAPAFSLLQWSVKKGSYSWEAYTSHEQIPSSFEGTQAFVFDWDQNLPKSFNNLFALLSLSKNKVFIGEQNVSSALALKIKKYLDKNYLNKVTISEVSEELRCSWGHMSRSFKKTYGISPVEYRHRLRLFNAILLLSHGNSVIESCFDSGFESLTQFNLHFKKHMGTQPAKYRSK